MEIRIDFNDDIRLVINKALELINHIGNHNFEAVLNFFVKNRGTPSDIQVVKDCAIVKREEFKLIQSISMELSIEQSEKYMEVFEIVARMGIGQFSMMLKYVNPEITFNIARDMDIFLKDITAMDHRTRCLNGITNKEVSEVARVSWYMYQAIRRELSWHKKGLDWRKNIRDWNTMMGVNYDNPFPELKDITIERVLK